MTLSSDSTAILVKSDIKPSVAVMSWSWVIILGCVPLYRVGIPLLSPRIPDLICLLLVACVIFGHFRSSAIGATWKFAVFCIPLAALFSGINSSISASLILAVKLVVLLLLSPMVFSYYRIAVPQFLSRVVVLFVGLQTVSAIAGLLQLTGMSVLGMVANSGRANGLAGHPNVLGLMCVVAIIICLGIKPATRRCDIFRILVTVVNAAALIGTGSISSMIAMTVSLVVLIAALRAAIKFIVTFIVLGVIALVLAAASGVETTTLLSPVESRVQEVTGQSDGVASFDIRQETYDFAFDSIQDDPISGVGLDGKNQGTFNGVTVVHNYLLRAWFQGGIFLAVSFSLITLVLVKRVVGSILTSRNAVPASVISAVITFALTSAFYEQQQYWFLVIIAMVSFEQTKSERPQSREGATDAGLV